LEVLVLAVSFGVALVVSFRTFYDSKAFGSASDYLTVLTTGVGAQLLIGGVFDALQRWRPPKAPAAAAKVG
jgi:ABC-type bacteriocin/lantibiotic exporter with double-glycine peptidase domain